MILVSLSRRRCKLPFVSPILSFLKGVAKLKELQDEGFIRSGASLESIGYVSGWEVTKSASIFAKDVLLVGSRSSGIFPYWLSLQVINNWESIFNIPRISWYG